ncbi:MAG: hypothetical protein HFACDABA_01830 [Anaerolineales bacterium]|nr:hypothetical protein [Anaerolineales bacterium]
MKTLDHTPFQDASGQIGLVNRIQGTLKYGLSWYPALEAQKIIVSTLAKTLEHGYTLIRNKELGASGIVAPLVLIGSAGIYLIDVTPLKGFYQARGNEWGTISNGRFQPAGVNLVARAEQLARVIEVFYQRQGITLPVAVEPVLMASDPGLHIETVRPAVRVVQSDAIERFAAGLLAARPSMNAQTASHLVERLISPRSAKQGEEPPPPAQDDPFAMQDETPFQMEPSSRLQGFLNSPKSDALIDSGQAAEDIGFAFDEARAEQPTVLVNNPAPGASKPASKRIFGMTLLQIVFLAAMALIECCILAGGAFFIFSQAQP